VIAILTITERGRTFPGSHDPVSCDAGARIPENGRQVYFSSGMVRL